MNYDNLGEKTGMPIRHLRKNNVPPSFKFRKQKLETKYILFERGRELG